MHEEMRLRSGGDGEPVLLLLHGLGATSDVWAKCDPVLARHWPGRWVAPDLPGHGASPALNQYTFDEVAANLARGLRGSLAGGQDVIVLGHSLGGVVGLALASGALDIAVRLVIGLGIKTLWTDAELARARELARRPANWFASRAEAGDRYLRVSGLTGLVPVDDPAVDSGLRAEDGRWRLAMDPGVWAIGEPDMPALLGRARARILLARGENDAMVTDQDLAQFGTPVVTLPGLGHNAHVESPGAVVRMCIAAM